MTQSPGLISGIISDWRERLAYIVATMRELSRRQEPLEMGRFYTERMRKLLPVDASLSLSRRDLSSPWYRITRSSRWSEVINPWKEKHLLPLFQGGLLGELIYGDEPRLLDHVELAADDPAHEYLTGFQSLLAIPMYDHGVALNMVVLLRQTPEAFSPEQFPELVWLSNLYGRATLNLVLAEQLKEAYETVDYEMKVVADIQRSLLPQRLPEIPTLSLATHYQTSSRAGGDYYDFFPLRDGRWGLLIADVSGHGTPAAVLMAVMHSLAHTYPGEHQRPGHLLEYLNRHLHSRYTAATDAFVTAFYGIYDPESHCLTYSSAGHNPPRLKRCSDGSLIQLDQVGGLPLGMLKVERYDDVDCELILGDQLLLYTDGITEAHNEKNEMFGLARLDRVLEDCSVTAPDLLRAVLEALEEFTHGGPAHDDRTLLVAKVIG